MAAVPYTGRGDEGETDLFSGQRVKKSVLRIETLGCVDELNSLIGLCRVFASRKSGIILEQIQNALFVVGSDLATPLNSKANVPRVESRHATELEQWTDGMNAKLPELRKFILPGGSEASAYIHLARVMCRRTERRAVMLKERGKINPAVIPYLNRLSSLLFVMARYENRLKNVNETEWKGLG